ncbi:MAG: transposase [Clostridium sp.]|nr:transposase [Clostridium sp.]
MSQKDKNYRNGYNHKNVKTSFGDVDVNVPRHRKANFEPCIIKKYETALNALKTPDET